MITLKKAAVWLLIGLVLVASFPILSWGEEARPGAAVATVVIDPGHGGPDFGAVGRNGLLEKNLTYSLALKLKESLERSGHRVILTRSGDFAVPEHERAGLANHVRADVMVCLHVNAAFCPRARGLQVYVARPDESMRLAECLARGLEEYGFSCGDVGQAPVLVLEEATMPAALVEMGFLTNAAEEKALGEEGTRAALAAGLSLGVNEFLLSEEGS